MDVLPSTKFIRLRHTGLTRKSILLADIDDSSNRKRAVTKLPVYVPFGQIVDILFDDRVALSYQQGDIRGYIDQGYLEAFIIDNPNLNLDSYNSLAYLPIVTVTPGESFILVDSSGGPVEVRLPRSELNMGPITIKRSSTDTNAITVVADGTDLIDGFTPIYAMLEALDWVELWPDTEGGWWRTSELSPGGGGGSSFIEEEFEVVNPLILSFNLSNIPAPSTLNVFLNGLRLRAGITRDYTIAGNVITLNPTYTLYVEDYVTATYNV